MENLIEAAILKGQFKGEHVLFPRIPMSPADSPVQLKRLQIHIALAIAMAIIK